MSTSQLDLQAYQEYWKRLTFEHDLINRRITWLLSSQTILFAAYGITFTLSSPKNIGIFPSVIAWSGMTQVSQF